MDKERRGGQQLQEIIQDLIIRFIICCPEEEHESFERLFFQIEEAHWFYMDEYRSKNTKLPLLNFKQFAELVFKNCPLLQQYKDSVQKYRTEWLQYKVSVPVCGAIVLNKKMNKALMVRGIGSSASWSFPRGKINRDEPTISCAIREVKEETGLDISALIQETEYLEMTINEQSVKLFLVVMDVDESEISPLVTQTKGEIGAIEWLHVEEDIIRGGVADKKRKFWSVMPFIRQLKPWIHKRRAATKPKSPKVARERPSKRSGKNSKKITATEIDYQIPVKPLPKSQPIMILKRGEALAVPEEHISSSYSPPHSFLTSQPQLAWSLPEHHSRPMPTTTSDSFLNFSFNADEIVGDMFVV
jgi:mRNA-decapping enzyme subunit 2